MNYPTKRLIIPENSSEITKNDYNDNSNLNA